MPNRPRDVDRESGLNRASQSSRRGRERRHQAAPPPPPPQVMSEYGSSTDEDVEEFAHATTRDDSLRASTTVVRAPTNRGAPRQRRTAQQEAAHTEVEPEKKPEPVTASHRLFLLAAARSIVPTPITFHKPSSLVPSSGNMFMALSSMVKVLGDNLRLIEYCQEYTSIGFYTYYSYVYFYQVLRARDAAGELTRLERRSLKIFEAIGKPEAWPIATPMIGFVQSLGAAQSPDKMFTYIVPALPDFSKFTADKAFHDLHRVTSIGRVPLVPAYQQFLKLLSIGKSYYTEDYFFVPHQELKPGTSFVGLEKSGATDYPFQTIAFNDAWNPAHETTEPIGQYQWGAREARLRRWEIPSVSDTANFTQMETYLFGDGKETHWIKNLLRLSANVNKFFPGSVNLDSIPPTTTMENFSLTSYSFKQHESSTVTPRVGKKDQWYQTRNNWYINVTAKYYGDISNSEIQAAAATSVTATYDDTLIPTPLTAPFEAEFNGPYFVSGEEHSIPLNQSEVIKQQDPTHQFTELIDISMYDQTGGK